MKKFSIITFCNKPLAEDNLLKKSCLDLGLHLEVLFYSPWKQNSIKLKLLYDFLQEADPDQLLLVVDALDVVLFDDAAIIEERFNSFNVDILISAESNYMFKNSTLWLKYFKAYPSQPTVYNFVNSGSYAGTARSLMKMLETMQKQYAISLSSEEEVLALKSDQYLIHRFYVDKFHEKGEKLKVALDSRQVLLGCTGGRSCIRKFQDHSKIQAFINFQIERNLVKLFHLHKYQSRFKDYEIRSGRFYNTKTQTTPSVMHLPGTWGNFSSVYNRFFSGSPSHHPTSLKKIAANSVSYFSYVCSIFMSWIVEGVKFLWRKLTH